ncbi:MAG TPA: hypothetical protein VII82_04435 [Polyangiaceae bacterium]
MRRSCGIGKRRLFDFVHAPLWLVALIAAVAAPFCATGIQAALESKLRRTTRATLGRALAPLESAEGIEHGGRIPDDPAR